MTNETNNLKLTGGGDAERPFDPKLESLLDEALAPEAIDGGVPRDLAARVFNATKDKLTRRRTVLGRIGFGSWSAMAASWIIAGGLAVTLATAAPAIDPIGALKRELRALRPADPIDQEIASV